MQSMSSRVRTLSESAAASGYTVLIYKKTLQRGGVSVAAKKRLHTRSFVFLSDLKRFERVEE